MSNHIYRGSNPIYATTTGSANAQVLTLPTFTGNAESTGLSLVSALSGGDEFTFKVGYTNSGALTLQIVGAMSIGPYPVRCGASALSGGEWQAGDVITVRYDASAFQMVGTDRFLASGTGAASRSVLNKLRERVSVADYTGVDPTGATDSYAGVVSAITAARAAGKELFIPAGTYRLDLSLTLSTYDRIVGEGQWNTILVFTNVDGLKFNQLNFTATTTITGITNANPGVFHVPSHGLSVDTAVYVQGVSGMTTLNGNYYWVNTVPDANHVTLRDATTPIDTSGYGAYTSGGTINTLTINDGYIHLEGFTVQHSSNAGANTNTAINFQGVSYSSMRGVRTRYFRTGLYMARGGGGKGCYYNNIESVRFQDNKFGLDMDDTPYGTSVNAISGGHLYYENAAGIWTTSPIAFQISGNGHRFAELKASFSGTSGAEGIRYREGGNIGQSVVANTLIEQFYCEGTFSYTIRIPTTTSGRTGNWIIGIHLDGVAAVQEIADPQSDLNILDQNGYRMGPGSIRFRSGSTLSAYVPWTSVAYASGNFSANNSMSWTVGSGDQVTYVYTLLGTAMTVNYDIRTSTVGGTPSTQLKLKIPGGYTAARTTFEKIAYLSDNGSDSDVGLATVTASDTWIMFQRNVAASTWTASTDNTRVSGVITFEVQ